MKLSAINRIPTSTTYQYTPLTEKIDATRILDWKIASMTTEIDLDRVGCILLDTELVLHDSFP